MIASSCISLQDEPSVMFGAYINSCASQQLLHYFLV